MSDMTDVERLENHLEVVIAQTCEKRNLTKREIKKLVWRHVDRLPEGARTFDEIFESMVRSGNPVAHVVRAGSLKGRPIKTVYLWIQRTRALPPHRQCGYTLPHKAHNHGEDSARCIGVEGEI